MRLSIHDPCYNIARARCSVFDRGSRKRTSSCKHPAQAGVHLMFPMLAALVIARLVLAMLTLADVVMARRPLP